MLNDVTDAIQNWVVGSIVSASWMILLPWVEISIVDAFLRATGIVDFAEPRSI